MENMAFTAKYNIDALKTLALFHRIEIFTLLMLVISCWDIPPKANNPRSGTPSFPWRVLHKIYGPIICLQYRQRVMISIGSYKVAHDLLEKRKVIYDSRPRFVVSGECVCKSIWCSMEDSPATDVEFSVRLPNPKLSLRAGCWE